MASTRYNEISKYSPPSPISQIILPRIQTCINIHALLIIMPKKKKKNLPYNVSFSSLQSKVNDI